MIVPTLKAALAAASIWIQPPPFDATYCMARTMWGEGQGDYVQMLHVGHTLWNRAKKDVKNVCKEARKPKQFIGYWVGPRDDADWRDAAEIAIHILSGSTLDLFGTTHFVDYTRVRPRWMRAMDVVGFRGNHVYMRER